jgi:hypothetical protein
MRASVSLHLQLRISRILAERFYVIGNEVSYDIKKPPVFSDKRQSQQSKL